MVEWCRCEYHLAGCIAAIDILVQEVVFRSIRIPAMITLWTPDDFGVLDESLLKLRVRRNGRVVKAFAVFGAFGTQQIATY